jgi:hypothetical protein
MSVPSIELSSISRGEMIGDGGEGEVFRIEDQPTEVLKLFKNIVRPEMDEAGLVATVGLLAAMSPQDQAFVKLRSAWPHTIVRENGHVVGFIMPSLGDAYFCSHGQKGNPVEGMNDWNKLAFRKSWMGNANLQSNSPALWFPAGQDLSSLDDSEKKKRENLLSLLLDLAKLFEIFHRYRIVVGDVSGRNILFSRTTGNTVMLIDCDGCRVENTVGVTRAKQSPDWFDPQLTDVTNINSDLYKLSIAIYRGYFSDGIGMPSNNKVLLISREDQEIHKMALRGVGASARPTASEWVKFLHAMVHAAENAGRPVIDWTDETDRPSFPPPPPRQRADRPNIPWQS